MRINNIKHKITGRRRELANLREKYNSRKGELVVVYGRRRVGKSSLIQHFMNFGLDGGDAGVQRIDRPTSSKKGNHRPALAPGLTFEGLENQRTPAQIKHFSLRLKSQIKDPLLQRAKFTTWDQIFEFLTEYCSRQDRKIIILFDEFQWMAANQSKLVALLKYYWDNHWKQLNLMLILCGSIASFMVRKVLRSKALYGRFSLQIHLKKLAAREAREFFPPSKSDDEVLRYLLVFGGVPKYLEEVTTKLSFEQNIERLFFEENALFLEEFDRIFNVHFREPRNYLNIIKVLGSAPLKLEEVSQSLKMRSSGGVKDYLENLQLAEFIRADLPCFSGAKGSAVYRLSDEFVNFYTKFVLPNKRIIEAGGGSHLFENKILKQLVPWLGLALERYVANNGIYIAELMNFADKVESFGGYYNKKNHVQVDLIYVRSDKTVSVCEIKLTDKATSTEVVPEFDAKLRKLPIKSRYSIHKVLIAPNGVSEALRNLRYFDDILTAKELLYW